MGTLPGEEGDPTWGEWGPYRGKTGTLHWGKINLTSEVINGLLVVTSAGNLLGLILTFFLIF